jgi:hypothetical protein
MSSTCCVFVHSSPVTVVSHCSSNMPNALSPQGLHPTISTIQIILPPGSFMAYCHHTSVRFSTVPLCEAFPDPSPFSSSTPPLALCIFLFSNFLHKIYSYLAHYVFHVLCLVSTCPTGMSTLWQKELFPVWFSLEYNRPSINVCWLNKIFELSLALALHFNFWLDSVTGRPC